MRNILQCWNGKDAGRYTNSIVNDGLQHQEYNPEVPIDLSRYPGDAQINQQIRALKSITQKIENAHKGLDVEWPIEGQHGDGKFYNSIFIFLQQNIISYPQAR